MAEITNEQFTEYFETVLEFLNHLEDVLDDKNYEKIDFNHWNRVSLCHHDTYDLNYFLRK
jgi:beta-glucanase (GH16 family)